MGTRTIILFSITEDDKLEEGIPIYKHLDGYPSNVLHLLRQYIYANKERLRDMGYFSAGFLRYVENYSNFDKMPVEFMEFKDPYTGYALFHMDIDESLLDGWEDYYYKVTPKKVYVYDGSNLDKMYEVEIEKLLEMPDDIEYFESLEKKIYEEYHGD